MRKNCFSNNIFSVDTLPPQFFFLMLEIDFSMKREENLKYEK